MPSQPSTSTFACRIIYSLEVDRNCKLGRLRTLSINDILTALTIPSRADLYRWEEADTLPHRTTGLLDDNTNDDFDHLPRPNTSLLLAAMLQ